MKSALMRSVRRLAAVLREPFRTLALVIMVRLSPRGRLLGLRVVDLTGEIAGSEARRALKRAIALIDLHSPVWCRRLRSDVSWVGIVYYGEPGYIFGVNACLLSREFLLREPTERVAGSLVHETCHARLAGRGFGPSSPHGERIEKLCTQAAVHFLYSFPEGHDLASRFERRIQLADVVPLSSQMVRFERYLGVLRQSGVPDWVVRLYAVLRAPGRRSTGGRAAR